MVEVHPALFFDSGGRPAARRLVTRFKRSNQNGAPCEMAAMVMIKPSNLKRQASGVAGQGVPDARMPLASESAAELVLDRPAVSSNRGSFVITQPIHEPFTASLVQAPQPIGRLRLAISSNNCFGAMATELELEWMAGVFVS